MIAGDGICNEEVVRLVVQEAPARIQDLIDLGVPFDKKKDGTYDLAKEGGHTEYRILHAKDKTGEAIEATLIDKVKNDPNIEIFEHYFAIEILTQHHLGIEVKKNYPGIKCYGAYVADLVKQESFYFPFKGHDNSNRRFGKCISHHYQSGSSDRRWCCNGLQGEGDNREYGIHPVSSHLTI